MKQRQKKGFTIVELLVVIAVIAVLAAVLIPVMVYLIDDAKTSADEQTVASLNKLIASETGDFETASDAVEAANDVGYNLETLDLDSENELVWDQGTGYFALIDEDGEEVYSNGTLSDSQYLWKIVGSDEEVTTATAAAGEDGTVTYAAKTIVASAATDAVYSYYLKEGYEPAVTFSVGVDAGKNEDLNIEVETSLSGILVNGNGGTVTISGSGSVTFYGEANYLAVESGSVTTAAGSSVNTIVYESGATVTVNGECGVSQEVDDISALNTSDFAGGLGTKTSPYEIATAEQFKNINNVTSQISGLYYDSTVGVYASAADKTYFILTASISLGSDDLCDGVGCVVKYFNSAVLDGNEKTVYTSVSVFGSFADSEISDLTVSFDDAVDAYVVGGYASIGTAYASVTDAALTNVTTEGTVSFTNRNSGLFVCYAGAGVSGGYKQCVTFTGCVNKADVYAPGGEKMYNAVFVGYAWGDAYLTFDKCSNKGTLVSGQAALFLGNAPSSGNEVSICANSCSNAGSIISSNAQSGTTQFVAISTDNATVYVDGTEMTDKTQEVYSGFSSVSANGLELALNDDGTFTVTESAADVAYYEIRYGSYFYFYNETYGTSGTDVQYITETVYASAFTDGSYTSGIQYLGFVTTGGYDSDAETATIGGYAAVQIDGVWYYVVESYTFSVSSWVTEDGYEKTEGTKAAPVTVTVTGYDSDGTITAVYTLVIA